MKRTERSALRHSRGIHLSSLLTISLIICFLISRLNLMRARLRSDKRLTMTKTDFGSLLGNATKLQMTLRVSSDRLAIIESPISSKRTAEKTGCSGKFFLRQTSYFYAASLMESSTVDILNTTLKAGRPPNICTKMMKGSK